MNKSGTTSGVLQGFCLSPTSLVDEILDGLIRLASLICVLACGEREA